MNSSTFGTRLSRFMIEKGMSISELAKLSGVHHVMIRRYLKGDEKGKEPTLGTLVQLAKALSCPLEELAGITETERPGRDLQILMAFMEYYCHLSLKEKSSMDEYMILTYRKSNEHDISAFSKQTMDNLREMVRRGAEIFLAGKESNKND